MNIGHGQSDNNITQVIRLNNHDIGITDSLKLLGVTIDFKLNFSGHENMICKIAGQKIGVLMRLRNLIPTNAKLMLFKTAMLPHLKYCHLVWHFCRASDSRKIDRMQERGPRAVFRNNVSYPELLKRAELPSLQNRRLQDICVLMYKAKNNLCPPYISDIFIEHRSKYNLRQSDFSAARYNSVTYGNTPSATWGPISGENYLQT